jgi:hypothetical protein
MITSLINRNYRKNKALKIGEFMKSHLVMEEKDEFRRVWNFVVPLHKLGNNSSIQSIPPLTKSSLEKMGRARRKRAS